MGNLLSLLGLLFSSVWRFQRAFKLAIAPDVIKPLGGGRPLWQHRLLLEKRQRAVLHILALRGGELFFQRQGFRLH